MLGSEYNWLIEPSRSATGDLRVRLVRSSLFTLAVAVFCVACTIIPLGAGQNARMQATPAAAIATAHTSTLEQPVYAEWPQRLLQFWFLIPTSARSSN